MKTALLSLIALIALSSFTFARMDRQEEKSFPPADVNQQVLFLLVDAGYTFQIDVLVEVGEIADVGRVAPDRYLFRIWLYAPTGQVYEGSGETIERALGSALMKLLFG